MFYNILLSSSGNVLWKQEWTVWSREDNEKARSSTTECVVTTCSRILEKRLSCCMYVRNRYVWQSEWSCHLTGVVMIPQKAILSGYLPGFRVYGRKFIHLLVTWKRLRVLQDTILLQVYTHASGHTSSSFIVGKVVIGILRRITLVYVTWSRVLFVMKR